MNEADLRTPHALAVGVRQQIKLLQMARWKLQLGDALVNIELENLK
ncbi:MAG: hypothetical protein UY48_C0011G0017 [Candidatus Gottesmanbacteria bacterium GW2011_GWB1_49_7]|uniref:Uncharacterized protein n=1 Tax=Candidatus Gottesmanbacteria bacterium GW2011_GWB1_49_7 TaxID=1618448 RepID=A0A0G1W1V6_9BACT|nr:MAG: hypothetical protein UY48_C0011G0017 [Candidatus Gottesmanbacteria bacterium GW2011_GWB1_49_7]